jgi:hypothetical protein
VTTRLTRQIGRALTGKGFEVDNTHHEMFWYVLDGKLTSVRTRISNGKREYDDGLLGLMANQLHLSKAQLLGLIDCDLKAEAYRRVLLDGGFFTLPEAPSAPRTSPPRGPRRKRG